MPTDTTDKTEKAAATAEAPPADTFQDVPLGGQPERQHVSYQDGVDATAAEHPTCADILKKLIAAMQKAIDDCPTGRSKGAMAIRNHVPVWKAQAEALNDGL